MKTAEQIAADLAESSHPDNWGVPCVYIEGWCKDRLGITVEGKRRSY